MISGYTVIRNAIKFDFPIEECIRSLAPVCDEVLVSAMHSEDDTLDLLFDLKNEIPHLRVIVEPFDNPGPQSNMWHCNWINRARSHLLHPVQLYLDADDVLDDRCHDHLRELASRKACCWFNRLNYFLDARHVVASQPNSPWWAPRMGPTEYFMPSDEPHPEGAPRICKEGVRYPDLKIFHYGYIRKDEAFIEKAEFLETVILGKPNPKLRAYFEAGKNWATLRSADTLAMAEDYHPKVAIKWLTERGRL